MIYLERDLMLFSLIYSDVSGGGYPTPKLNHDTLYKLFFYSVDRKQNIFKLDRISLRKIILESVHILKLENPRIKAEKKVENTVLYFLSEDGILNLERLKKRGFSRMAKNTGFGGITQNLVFVNQKRNSKREYAYIFSNTMRKA